MQKNEKKTYCLEWRDAMSVGIECIDNDHKKLLSLIAQLSEAIDTNKEKKLIEAVFSELGTYALEHFAREEELMRQCQYSGLEAHIKLHKTFVDKLPDLKANLLLNQSKHAAEETYLFLFRWLINHIIGEDSKFFKQAQKYKLTTTPKQPKTGVLTRLALHISHKIKLSRRVLLVSLLPIIALIALSASILTENLQHIHTMEVLQKDFHILRYASIMNHQLQIERGLSSGYMSSKSQAFLPELMAQRKQTDTAAKKLLLQINQLPINQINTELRDYTNKVKRYLTQLDQQRKMIAHTNSSIQNMLERYTLFIDALRDLPDSMLHLEMNSALINNIAAFSSIAHMKEALGLQRSFGTRVLAGSRISSDSLHYYIGLLSEQKGALQMFEHAATKAQKETWKKLQSNASKNELNELKNHFIDFLSGQKVAAPLNSKQWFQIHTSQVNQAMALSTTLLNNLEKNIHTDISSASAKLYMLTSILIGLVLLTTLFSRIFTLSITLPLKRIINAITNLSQGNLNIRYDDTYANDELSKLTTAYEKCRISLLQADSATSLYIHRQALDSKRKLCEQRVKSAIQNYALDSIITCGKDFIITDINPATEALFLLTKETAIGKPLHDLIEGIEQQEHHTYFETVAMRADAKTIDIAASISSIHLDEFEGFICFIRDISKAKKANRKVKQLSQAIGQTGESILITNNHGTIEYVNTAFTKLTGFSAEEAIGKNSKILNSGNQSPVFYEHMWKTISAGNTWQNKVVEKRKDGTFFPVILTISPIFDDQGIITHFVGSHTDISDLETMEKQFRQSQKMEAIGTLVGGIAHDFNNMLAGITGNLYLIKNRIGDMPNVTGKLDNIEYLSFKAAAMIKQLLTFARKDTVAIESLQLTPFIKETMKLLHASVPENIDLTENYCADALLIKADATQLHQVLMNLINNARDAVEDVEHPHISITLDVFQANQAFMQSHQAFTVEKYAHLSVMDNGCGIDKEHIDHLFEPFFTNKEPGKGTGLGLAMVFGAIANHHGHIDVESTHGEGATFHIYLPLEKVNKPVEAVQKDEDESNTLGKGELILLADDQTIVLQVANEVLNTLGYRTMTAENGKIALELYQAHAKDIDLCILDVVMPIMGGDKAAEAIRQINPQAKIIFSTGYDKELLKGMEKELILTKPYKFDIMNDMIQGILKG